MKHLEQIIEDKILISATINQLPNATKFSLKDLIKSVNREWLNEQIKELETPRLLFSVCEQAHRESTIKFIRERLLREL